MRKQHRRLPTLECLDDRIVPSAMGGAAAAMVSGTTGAEHAPVISKDAHLAEAAAHAKARARAGDIHHAKDHAKLHHAVKKNHTFVTPAASTQSSAQVSTGSTMVAAAAAAAPAASAQASIAATTPTSSATSTSANGSATLTATPAITVNASTSAPAATTATTAATTTTTTTNPGDIENGPLAKAGQDLVNIYEEYEQQLGSSSPTFPQASVIHIEGTDVGVDIRVSGGDFNAFVSAMTALGMQVQNQSAAYATVEGYLPIGQLVAAAQNSQTLSISPMYIGFPG